MWSSDMSEVRCQHTRALQHPGSSFIHKTWSIGWWQMGFEDQIIVFLLQHTWLSYALRLIRSYIAVSLFTVLTSFLPRQNVCTFNFFAIHLLRIFLFAHLYATDLTSNGNFLSLLNPRIDVRSNSIMLSNCIHISFKVILSRSYSNRDHSQTDASQLPHTIIPGRLGAPARPAPSSYINAGEHLEATPAQMIPQC